MLDCKEGRLLRQVKREDTTMKINILLCDDDKDFLQRLTEVVTSQPLPPGISACVTKSAHSSAITDRQLSQYQIMFLDIDMDERSGMDIARRVRELHLDTIIIFVTNYPEFSMEGYEVRAFRYLLKQELQQKLPLYFRDALAEIPHDKKELRFSVNAEPYRVAYKDILYLESQQRIVVLHTENPLQGGDHFYGKLEDLENELESDGFLRIQNGSSFSQTFVSGFLMHCLMLASCYLQLFIRKHNQNQTTNYSWYTVPAILSTVSVLLIFFFGSCFEKGWISILPLCVCASFITCMQIAALLLVSWMEQTAHFREEALSLQTKSMAQKESIEALSTAYTQQRKLTHDFRAHLDTLSAMLVQQPFDIDAIKSYVRSLQSAQTSRILLVNTHHSTLDALLNQKALVARNRSIDVQFRVNDLSAVKIDLVDLTVIISNTLDNAIEACEKLPVQERQIYVQVVLNDNELFYAVRNRSLPIDVSSDRLPVTTKENPSFHGYGLQNVQTTLAKYHSVYAMDYADGWFEFATDLPNTLIS